MHAHPNTAMTAYITLKGVPEDKLAAVHDAVSRIPTTHDTYTQHFKGGAANTGRLRTMRVLELVADEETNGAYRVEIRLELIAECEAGYGSGEKSVILIHRASAALSQLLNAIDPRLARTDFTAPDTTDPRGGCI